MIRKRMPGEKITFAYLIENTVPEGDCFLWAGKIRKNGYGTIKVNRKQILVTRVMAEILFGKSDQYVLHSCDNPRCINPRHLSYGDQFQNMRECRDRRNMSGKQIVTRQQAHAIKYLETGTQKEIGERYGISRSSVGNIRSGYSWADLQKNEF